MVILFVYTVCVPLKLVLKETLDVKEEDIYSSKAERFQMWVLSGKIVCVKGVEHHNKLVHKTS